MAFLREIQIEGLFGLYDHHVELRTKPPVTFMAGPNGVGKTTLLRLTHALASGNYFELSKQQFQRLTIVSRNGSSLIAEPQAEVAREEPFNFPVLLTLRQPRRKAKEEVVDARSRRHLRIPGWIEQVGPDLYRDMRNGRLLDGDDVEMMYGPTRVPRRPRPQPEPPSWFVPKDWLTDFIETKRLDALMMRARRSDAEADEDQAPINYYLDAVTSAMRSARIGSSRIAQLRDRSFARRMLERGGPRSVNEERLRDRYSQVETKAAELAANGLLVESLDILPRGKLTPTEKRVMQLFLDDFEAKLQPLQPISARLAQLRDIVGSKFLNKRMEIDAESGPVFLAAPGDVPLDPDSLSSGEQHEIALLSNLLFSVEPGTTVLIDEPELSLHVSWQHKMLGDLSAIASLVGLAFVLATHSTAIINGHWELVEELGPIDDSL
jgi:predicted ATPase